jgi:hypothetical protein
MPVTWSWRLCGLLEAAVFMMVSGSERLEAQHFEGSHTGKVNHCLSMVRHEEGQSWKLAGLDMVEVRSRY